MENNLSLPFMDSLEGDRNQRTFEGEQRTIETLKDSLITNMYMWSRGFLLGDGQEGPTYLLSFIEWLGSFS